MADMAFESADRKTYEPAVPSVGGERPFPHAGDTELGEVRGAMAARNEPYLYLYK